MPIDTSSLLRLDPNKSYYLSNTTGEIKEAGVVQWLRCKLGVGGGRAKAAALAERIKTALLAEASIHGDLILEDQIGRLNTNKSLSGRRLRDIAAQFSLKLSARRCLEQKVAGYIDVMADDGFGVAPDQESKECMAKVLVYANSSIIHNVGGAHGRCDDVPGYVHMECMKFDVVQLAHAFDQAAKNVRNACPDFPVVEHDGKAAFRLDELHFRIFLLCALDGRGELDLDHLAEKLARYSEDDIQALREQILAVPLASAQDRNAIRDFRNAMDDVFANNHLVQGAIGARDQGRNIEITE